MSDDILNQIQAEKAKRTGNTSSVSNESGSGVLEQVMAERQRRKQQKESEPFYQPALETITEIGETIDSYTGAPTRAAADELINNGSLLGAASQFAEQFGEDPSNAPTGKQLAEKVGISAQDSLADISPSLPEFLNPTSGVDRKLREQGFEVPRSENKLIEKGDPLDFSKAGAAGLAIDIVADPLTILPIGAIAKISAKSAKGATKGIGGFIKGTAKANEIEKNTSSILDIAKKSGKSVKDSLSNIINPKKADDFESLTEIAKKNGIDVSTLPEAIEYGEDSFISRASRNLAEGPLGEEKLQKFEKATFDVSNAADKKIQSFSDRGVLKPVEAGALIRESYDNGVKNFFNQMDFTYSSIVKQAPAMKMGEKSLKNIDSKLVGLDRWAKGRVKRGIDNTQRSQGKEILNSINAIKNSKGNFKQMTEALNNIGEVAYKTKNYVGKVPSDIKNLRKIYSVVKKEIIGTVRENLGDDIADALINNNAQMSKFFEGTQGIERILSDRNVADESVFRWLIKNGDSKKIEALKSVIDPQSFKTLKASYLDGLISRNADGVINFQSSLKKIQNDDRIAMLFSPDEVGEIAEILRLGKRMGRPVLSSSGTGGSNMFRSMKESIRNTVENDAIIDALKERSNRLPKQVSGPSMVDNVTGAFNNNGVKGGYTGSRLLSIENNNRLLSDGSETSNRDIASNPIPLLSPEYIKNTVDSMQLTPRLKNAVSQTLIDLGPEKGIREISKISKPLADKVMQALRENMERKNKPQESI